MAKLLSLGLSLPEQRSTPLGNPAIPLSGSVAWEFLGGGHGSEAAEIVTPASAMQLATVNACTQLIASSISSLPLVLYERSGSGKQAATSNPLFDLLAHEPNLDSTAATLWETFIGSVLLTGNGFIEIVRNASGTVTGLWYLDPNHVTVRRLPTDGSLIYRTTEGGKTRDLKHRRSSTSPRFQRT